VDPGVGRLRTCVINVKARELDLDFQTIVELRRISSGVVLKGDEDLVKAVKNFEVFRTPERSQSPSAEGKKRLILGSPHPVQLGSPLTTPTSSSRRRLSQRKQGSKKSRKQSKSDDEGVSRPITSSRRKVRPNDEPPSIFKAEIELSAEKGSPKSKREHSGDEHSPKKKKREKKKKESFQSSNSGSLLKSPTPTLRNKKEQNTDSLGSARRAPLLSEVWSSQSCLQCSRTGAELRLLNILRDGSDAADSPERNSRFFVKHPSRPGLLCVLCQSDASGSSLLSSSSKRRTNNGGISFSNTLESLDKVSSRRNPNAAKTRELGKATEPEDLGRDQHRPGWWHRCDPANT